MNAILHVLKTGCQWCQLPKDFGHWNQVYTCFRRWRLAGIWERVLQALREEERLQRVGKKPTPTIAIIDPQSVKTTFKGGTRLLRVRKLKGAKPHCGRYTGFAIDGYGAFGRHSRSGWC